MVLSTQKGSERALSAPKDRPMNVKETPAVKSPQLEREVADGLPPSAEVLGKMGDSNSFAVGFLGKLKKCCSNREKNLAIEKNGNA